MALTIVGMEQIRPDIGGIEQLTTTTSTSEQSIGLQTLITTLSGTSATAGHVHGKFLLGDGVDGQRKVIYNLATGRSNVNITNFATGMHYFGFDISGVASASDIAGTFRGAATGALVFTVRGQWAEAIFLDGGWRLIGGQATFATSMAT